MLCVHRTERIRARRRCCIGLWPAAVAQCPCDQTFLKTTTPPVIVDDAIAVFFQRAARSTCPVFLFTYNFTFPIDSARNRSTIRSRKHRVKLTAAQNCESVNRPTESRPARKWDATTSTNPIDTNGATARYILFILDLPRIDSIIGHTPKSFMVVKRIVLHEAWRRAHARVLSVCPATVGDKSEWRYRANDHRNSYPRSGSCSLRQVRHQTGQNGTTKRNGRKSPDVPESKRIREAPKCVHQV